MKYCCPKCYSNYRFHEEDCKWSGIDWHQIEKAYIDILSILTRAPQTLPDLADATHGEWSDIHQAVFERFPNENRVESIGTVEQGGEEHDVWRLLTPDEYREESKNPTHDDLKVVHENGPVDGCKDDAVVAMVAFWEWKGFSWGETKDYAVEWLETTNAWERGSWEERSPEQLIESKKHVFDNSYGWKSAAQQAAGVIRSSEATA